MRETLLALVKLQEIDSKALEFDRSAAQIPARVRELEGELNVIRTEVGALRAELDTKKREQGDTEGLIRDESAKLQKWKRRLVDIKTPREYQALSREVEQGERQVREAEDKVVALMTEIEQRQIAVGEREGSLKGRESEVNLEIRELRTREAKLSREAADARIGRNELIAKIPPKVLQLYERVRAQRRGVAISYAAKGSCTGCNVTLRPQLVVEIRKLDAIHQCPQCSRILVLDSLVSTAAVAPPSE